MIACVAASCRVMWQAICGVVMRLSGTRRAPAGRRRAGPPGRPSRWSAVEARRGSGLEPAHARSQARRRVLEQTDAPAPRRSRPGRPPRSLADMDQAAQESAGGQHHGAGAQALARRPVTTPATRPSASGSDPRRPPPRIVSPGLLRLSSRLHGLAVELAVGLGARPAHRRTLAAVEHAELDAARHRRRGPSARRAASISRTRWPLPSPPMAGLQDISPIVAILWVSSRVRAPTRAAAAAASQPAWPPPMTMTSH